MNIPLLSLQRTLSTTCHVFFSFSEKMLPFVSDILHLSKHIVICHTELMINQEYMSFICELSFFYLICVCKHYGSMKKKIQKFSKQASPKKTLIFNCLTLTPPKPYTPSQKKNLIPGAFIFLHASKHKSY
jgi:hypothetical protein